MEHLIKTQKHMYKKLDEDLIERLKPDTKKRTAQRHEDDKMHPLSQLAILSGFIAAGAVLYWLGAIVDAFIGLVNLG